MDADRLARWYRSIEYAAFGRGLERQRFSFLSRLSHARTILILGEGDGRALERLVGEAPHARIDVIESSARMIALARRRVGEASGDPELVQFFRENALDLSWAESQYDGIVTCFFLDCFAEAEARNLIERLARSLTPEGAWVVSEFAIPPDGWHRWMARVWIWAMYRFFRLSTGLRVSKLPPYERLLVEAGMCKSESRETWGGMIVSQVWRRSPKNDYIP